MVGWLNFSDFFAKLLESQRSGLCI